MVVIVVPYVTCHMSHVTCCVVVVVMADNNAAAAATTLHLVALAALITPALSGIRNYDT